MQTKYFSGIKTKKGIYRVNDKNKIEKINGDPGDILVVSAGGGTESKSIDKISSIRKLIEIVNKIDSSVNTLFERLNKIDSSVNTLFERLNKIDSSVNTLFERLNKIDSSVNTNNEFVCQFGELENTIFDNTQQAFMIEIISTCAWSIISKNHNVNISPDTGIGTQVITVSLAENNIDEDIQLELLLYSQPDNILRSSIEILQKGTMNS